MLILFLAILGAACAYGTRLLARRLVSAREGNPDESWLLRGKLSVAIFMGIGSLGFTLIAALIGFSAMVRLIQFLLVFQILLCLSAVDIAIRRIPNEMLLALFIVYALGHTLSAGWSEFASNLLGAGIAAVLFTMPARMGLYPIGWGDIKYATLIGFCFGLTGLLQVTIVMGLGLGLCAIYLIISHRGGLKSIAAIGPYLTVGAIATMVFPVLHSIF